MPLPNVVDGTSERCHATAKHSGEPCKNLAMGGTGVCKFHGAKGGRPPQTGLYSGQSSESLNKKIDRAVTFERSLNDEIALMKGVAQELLSRIEQEQADIFDSKTLLKLQTTADSIRKLIETQMKIEGEQKFMLSMTDMRLIMNQISMVIKDILSEYVKDDADYQAALKKTSRMLGDIKVLDGEVKASGS